MVWQFHKQKTLRLVRTLFELYLLREKNNSELVNIGENPRRVNQPHDGDDAMTNNRQISGWPDVNRS